MYTLKKFGSFIIPGRKIEITNQPTKIVKRNENVSVEINPNGEYVIESMYVQYFIPVQTLFSVILVHGGGQTGAIWENTPDGRDGWLQFFLRNNIAVYIVDTVERGRSGWCPFPAFWPEEPELRNDTGTWFTFRLGEKGKPFDNLQFPMEAFDNMLTYNVPRWNINLECSAKALSILIDRIGPCSIIAHSQGCGIAMQAIETTSSLIQKVVLIEPANFFKPNISNSANPIDVMILFGDNLAQNTFWQSMKDLAISYVQYLNQHQFHASLIELPTIGIHGNSHAMMLDRNNETVAQYILDWLNNSETSS